MRQKGARTALFFYPLCVSRWGILSCTISMGEKAPKQPIGFHGIVTGRENGGEVGAPLPAEGSETAGEGAAAVSVDTAPQSKPEDAKHSGPIWKVYAERAKTPEQKTKLQERKQWLSSFFLSQNVDHITRRQGILDIAGSVIDKKMPPFQEKGANPESVDAFSKLLQRESVRKRSEELLSQLQQKPDQPLLSFFDSLTKPEDIQAAKLVSVALLKAHIPEHSKTYQENLRSDQQRFIRLGELMGVEMERRQLEWGLAHNKNLEPKSQEKFYRLFTSFARSEDIPDVFKSRFERTRNLLLEKYPAVAALQQRHESKPGGSPVPEQIYGPSKGEWQIAQRQEHVAAMVEQYKNPNSAEGLERLATLKQQLMESNPLVREMEQNIYEEQLQYSDSFLTALKDRPPLSAKPEHEVYRKNFIDSMYQQIRHSQFINSKPSLFNRAVRGIAEKWDAHIQVVGFWNATFRWKWTREKMQEARNDVISSLQNVAGVGFDPDMAAYHVAELAMANLNEQKSEAEGAQQGSLARRLWRRLTESKTSPPLSSQQALEGLYGPAAPTQIDQPRLTVDETSERYKEADAAIQQYYESQAQPVKQLELERGPFFYKLVAWREANPDVKTLKDFKKQAQALWVELDKVASANNQDRIFYWNKVGEEIINRQEGYKRVA